MAEKELSKILTTILHRDNNTDIKELLFAWLTKWIFPNKNINDIFKHITPDSPLQGIHNNILTKYSQGFLIVDEHFINELFMYMKEVQISSLISNKYLDQCLELLIKLKQNFSLTRYNSLESLESYPNMNNTNNSFEEYGRAIYSYFTTLTTNNVPFLMKMGIIYLHTSEEDNIVPELIKIFDLITSIKNDINWLHFLHGNLININNAMSAHNTFCQKWKLHRINANDNNMINKVIHDFVVYLRQIYDCLFNISDMKNCSPPLLKYPGILWYITSSDDNDNDNNNDKYYSKNYTYYSQIKIILDYLYNNNSYLDNLSYITKHVIPMLKEYIKNTEG